MQRTVAGSCGRYALAMLSGSSDAFAEIAVGIEHHAQVRSVISPARRPALTDSNSMSESSSYFAPLLPKALPQRREGQG